MKRFESFADLCRHCSELVGPDADPELGDVVAATLSDMAYERGLEWGDDYSGLFDMPEAEWNALLDECQSDLDEQRDEAPECTCGDQGLGNDPHGRDPIARHMLALEVVRRHEFDKGGREAADVAWEWSMWAMLPEDIDEWCRAGVIAPADAATLRMANVQTHEMMRNVALPEGPVMLGTAFVEGSIDLMTVASLLRGISAEHFDRHGARLPQLSLLPREA